jgi:Ca-activated chloride channel family protein
MIQIYSLPLHWGNPLITVIAVPVAAILTFLLVLRFVRSKRALARLVPRGNYNQQLQGYSVIKRWTKLLLYVVAIWALVIALMRPQWHETTQAVRQEARDLLIALDVSRSMLATDMPPDRLAFAKQKIKDLLRVLDAERVGLILFSGTAFVQCPLTEDESACLMFLKQVDAETISSGTTSLEQAIQEALRVFKKMPERKSKLLLLITDGEDFSSSLLATKQEAAQMGLHIITMGVGTAEGAPIPLYDQKGKQTGHQLDDKGNVVITRMNPGILERVAQDTGGLFVQMTIGDEDIRKVVSFVRTFDKERLQDKQVKQFQEQYHYPLLVSLGALMLEWLL